jgi:hypothetical protein
MSAGREAVQPVPADGVRRRPVLAVQILLIRHRQLLARLLTHGTHPLHSKAGVVLGLLSA